MVEYIQVSCNIGASQFAHSVAIPDTGFCRVLDVLLPAYKVGGCGAELGHL